MEPIELGKTLPRVVTTFFEWIIIIGGVSVLTAVFFVLHAVQVSREDLLVNRENGYKNRAALCDLQLGIGLSLSATCGTPQVKKYRDPTIVASSSASARTSNQTQILMCQVLLRQFPKQQVPECVPILERAK